MGIPYLSRWFSAEQQASGRVAIGLSAYGVYLAQVVRDGAIPRVLRCEYHATGQANAAALKELCRSEKLADAEFITLLAPDEYQMLLVETPNVPATELKAAIRWKIKDSLSYHIDDATVDILQIPASLSVETRDHPAAIYAIAAPNTTLQQRMVLFAQAGIALKVIDIPELAQRNLAVLFERRGLALALLAFDGDGGLLTFSADGELCWSRRIEITAGQLHDADEELRAQTRGRLKLEVQRSLDYFDRQFEHLVFDRLLVSAPDAEELAQFLDRETDAKTDALELAQVMDISAVPALDGSEFVASVLPVLGAALRQEGQA